MTQVDRILEGAEQLFFKAGIRSVTMDDIARHIGMSKKTVYIFYKDKDELVTALVGKKLEEDKERMCSMAAESENVMEEMITMMKCAEDFFSKINPILIHDMQKYYPASWQLLQRFKAEIVVENLQNILSRGIDQGYVRPEIDPKTMARMHVLQVEAGFNSTVFPPTEYNIWKVQLQFLEHFLYGVCTHVGYELLERYKNMIEQE
jgi:AcrR family transcriptional regulator